MCLPAASPQIGKACSSSVVEPTILLPANATKQWQAPNRPVEKKNFFAWLNDTWMCCCDCCSCVIHRHARQPLVNKV